MTTLTLDKMPGWLAEYGRTMRASAMAGLLSAAARGTAVIQTQIIPMRTPEPVDRGVYKAGWKFRPTADGAEIYNAEAVSVLIEEGVRAANVKPGREMISALTEWVIRKNLVSKRGNSKATQQQMATSVAWAISRSMRKKGIFNRPGPGLGIMRELVDRYIVDFVEEEVVAALVRGAP